MKALAVKVLRASGQLDRAISTRHRWRSRQRLHKHKRLNREFDRKLESKAHNEPDTVRATIFSSSGPERVVLARVRRSDRVIDAMRSNRNLVEQALMEAEIPFRRISLDTGNRYRVAVADDQRMAVQAALSKLRNTTYVYLDSRKIPRPRRLIHVTLLDDRPTWALAESCSVWRVFEHLATSSGTDVLGDLHGCEIEFWRIEDGDLVAARWNEEFVRLPADIFSYSERTPLPLPSRVHFPIDVVYTWVAGDDPAWQQRRQQHMNDVHAGEYHAEAASRARFESRDELKYSLRSVHRYADFVRHIYIVTDQQRPDWLQETENLSVVDHHEIFENRAALPTFNSHSIESQLHRIDGLAEHYLYMNDDFFFGRRVEPELFFTGAGLARQYQSHAHVPVVSPSSEVKPVDAAALNVQRLIQREFNVTPTLKFKHAPYPQLRSVNREIERLFPEEWRQTQANRFRHPSDIAVASSLHHYVALLTGKGVPGEITARYVDLGRRNVAARLSDLLNQRNFDSLCLNDTDRDEIDENEKNHLVRKFLESYFPSPSPFEVQPRLEH